MIIAIDFDGTCVTHDFPNIGKDIGAVPVLKELIQNKHKLILFTMRSDVINAPSPEFPGRFTGNYLTDAVNWFKQNEIPLYGIQTNPTQNNWTTSPKVYANLYIDDSALGIPLIYGSNIRPYVDWEAVRNLLIMKGLIR